MPEAVHYAITFPDVHSHLIEVTITIPSPGTGSISLTMPSWSPGSYLLREYGRHVQAFEATTANGHTLPWAKKTRGTWAVEIAEPCDTLVVRYRVFSHDLNVRANHVEDTHAFLNGPTTFMLVAGRLQGTHTVEIDAPYDDWHIHTGMTCLDEAPHTGGGRFQAADFDELVDCPFVMGPMEAITFEAGGKPQRLVMVGEHNAPIEKLTADMITTIEATGRFFGRIPYDDYLTVVLHSATGRGGLEHRNSTILMFPHHHYGTEEGYEDFMALFSHEHFHVWNVKRIRPAVLGPFDYANENYTRALWVMEGITCYYENIMLMRGGLMTSERFTELLGDRIGALQTTPGRALHSLEDASFDAWIKLYRRDESTPNTTISYYLKGEVVAFALDLSIRARSGGTKSLDDVMHFLWKRFEEVGTGFPEEKFQQYVEDITGASMDDFFGAYVRGTEELNYEKLLALVGLHLEPAKEPSNDAWLGVNTRFDGDRVFFSTVLTDSPAARAGLYAGDELIALGGFKIDRHNFKKGLGRFEPDAETTAHVFRRGKLRQTTLTFGHTPTKKYALKPTENASPDALSLREAWLAIPTP